MPKVLLFALQLYLSESHFHDERAVELGRVRLGEARRIRARVPVVEDAEVVAEVGRKAALVSAVPVPFHAGGHAGRGIRDPADVRRPRADVEAALVAEVEAALHRGLLVGLADAAENVLAVEADVARERPIRLGLRGLGGRWCCRRRGGLRERRAGKGRGDREAGSDGTKAQSRGHVGLLFLGNGRGAKRNFNFRHFLSISCAIAAKSI